MSGVTGYPIAIISLLLLGVSLVIVSNMVFYTILGEVNAKRAPGEGISMLFANTKFTRILNLHAQLFPDSKKRQQFGRLLCAGFVVIGAGFILDIIHYGHW